MPAVSILKDTIWSIQGDQMSLWVLLFILSDSLWPHGLQHARHPYPSLSPGVCSNSCLLGRWCHPTISSSAIPFSSCPSSLSIRVFSNESVLHIRWPKYCSFSFSNSPSNEYSRLTSFWMDWLDLPTVQGTLESSLAPQFKNINSSALSLLYGPTLTSMHDNWKRHNFD